MIPLIVINLLKDNLENEDIEKDYPVFIESGTLYGNTIIPLEKHFHELHTIEIKEEFFVNIKNKCNKSKKFWHNPRKEWNVYL